MRRLTRREQAAHAFGAAAALALSYAGTRAWIAGFAAAPSARPQPPADGNRRAVRDDGRPRSRRDGGGSADASDGGAVIVAVIDTGVDVAHPSLAGALWTNEGEAGPVKSRNGVDDDGNGFVDDVHGWNFVAQSADVFDRNGHGTHVAGLVARAAPDARPAGRAKIMALKYCDPGPDGTAETATDTIGNTARAIDYAVAMGARIINYSGGGPSASPREEAALKRAAARGVLVIAAAGNESNDADVRRFYPASYSLPNILSVASVAGGGPYLSVAGTVAGTVANPVSGRRVLPSGALLPSSNWGARSVHLAAPGERLVSTLPGGRFGPMTGTSQATAVVSAAVADAVAQDPSLRGPSEIIARLERSLDRDSSLAKLVRFQGKLNALRAAAMKGRSANADGSPRGGAGYQRADSPYMAFATRGATNRLPAAR